ncbi:MAG: sugar ABC transporter permease [Fimbriimonadaceae bacterium]|nr:sugar ABC transporter permease [Fimbriimonadaceae bacterium]
MKGHLAKDHAKNGILFALPWIIGFSVFLLYPLVQSLYFSFTDYSVLRPPVWIGLKNYTNLLQDEVFIKTLSNTFLFAALSLPAGLVFSIGLALLLNTKVKGLAFYRTLFFIPSIVPPVSLAMLWLFLFRGDGGLVNLVLETVGIRGPDWLGSPEWSKPALVLMGLWGVGNAVVIYLAGLQNVPQALYEAADLDGAGPWTKTWNVTLPMISPVIQFNLVMGVIGTFQVFTIPYIMFSGGGPDRSALFYSMYLYDNAFVYQRMGYASAMGWVMFLIIFALTMIVLRMSEKRVHYGS